MKKYLGIVKRYHESMSGIRIEILTKRYNDSSLIDEWFKLYPNCEHVMLNNNKKLDSMFDIFEDMTPITEEEKRSMQRTMKLYKDLMSDN